MNQPTRFEQAFGDWTPRAVVFDCDGLLLDTESVWQRAQDGVVADLGAELLESDHPVLHGATIEDAAQLIAQRSTAAESEILEGLHRAFDRELGEGIRRMPGAQEVVRAIAAKVPVACASNSWLSALDEKLVDGGLREHFTALEASDTVERPKPAPDMYAAAARALGVPPQDTLAFEDSDTGGRSALDAGLRLVAVPTADHGVAGADLNLVSLEDPELLAWIRTW